MIQLRDIRKNYGSTRVLDGVDLAFRSGRITALVGPNAAGKTTMLKLMLGLARPDSGCVLFDGIPVAGEIAHRERIGYMPQIAQFPANLTGAELIRLVEDLRGRRPEMTGELIAAFDVGCELDKPLRTLSGGTRQKINAVVAFLFSPDLLVLDEPTAGLDPLASSALKDHVLEARGRGTTAIITSHVMAELEELADDVAFLVDGRIQYHGPLADLVRHTSQRNLERAVASMLRRVA